MEATGQGSPKASETTEKKMTLIIAYLLMAHLGITSIWAHLAVFVVWIAHVLTK